MMWQTFCYSLQVMNPVLSLVRHCRPTLVEHYKKKKDESVLRSLEKKSPGFFFNLHKMNVLN